MGSRFWVGCGFFFLGGRGGGRGSARSSTSETFSHDDSRFQTDPFFCVIYYILISGGFAAGTVYVTCYFCYLFSLGSSSGSTGSVRIYRSVCEHYTPNIYRCIPT